MNVILPFIVVLSIAALAIYLVRRRQKEIRRREIIEQLKSKQQQVFLVRAVDIIPGMPSRLIDHPENANLIFAVLGVLFFYLYFVILIGFPPLSCVAGILAALIPSYLRSVWIKILDINATHESLKLLNTLSGLLSSPNANQAWLERQAENLGQSEWVRECFKRAAEGQEIRFPSLQRVTGVWASIAQAMSAGGENYMQTGKGISSALVIQVGDISQQVEEVDEATEVLVALSNAILPGAIGIGMITIIMGVLRGTGRAGPLEGIQNLR